MVHDTFITNDKWQLALENSSPTSYMPSQVHDECTEPKSLLSRARPFPLLVTGRVLLLRLASLCKLSCPLLLTSKFRLACPLLLSFLPLHPLLLPTLFLQASSKQFFEPSLPPKTICVLVLFHIFWHFKIYPREVLA